MIRFTRLFLPRYIINKLLIPIVSFTPKRLITKTSVISAAVLTNFGGFLNISHDDVIFYLISAGRFYEIKKFIESGKLDVNKRHTFGWTPLMVAAVNGEAEIVQLLLDNGADPNLKDGFSNIFDSAASNGFVTIHVQMDREYFFSSQISPLGNFKGCTALHYAVAANNISAIEALLEKGADPLIENDESLKPVDYARSAVVVELLQKHSQKSIESKNEKAAEERRLPIDSMLREVIVGQENAILTVSSTVTRKQNGWIDNKHCLVFLFLGSSGIGKTEMAKQLAKYIHGDNSKAFIRMDMSEFQEKHEVAKFIGAPPGYVGHNQGGQLTNMLKNYPNAVVLFDEVEKAHPDVLTIMLQLFDEGRITDGKGETVDCKDAIFVMTSNLASEEIAEYGAQLREEAEERQKAREVKGSDGVGNIEEVKEILEVSREFNDRRVRPILKRHFRRDEFLGRINEFVYFLPFSKEELRQLIVKELTFWAEKAMEINKITLEWDNSVVELMIEGYDIHYGARSIKHEVERRIINQIAAAHEQKLIGEGSVIVVGVDGGKGKGVIKLEFKKEGSVLSSIKDYCKKLI